MNLLKQSILLYLVLFSLSACIKPPEFAKEPFITGVSISNGNFFEEDDFGTPIILQIGYQDGDGDISIADGDTFTNIFITDPLLDITSEFSVSEYIPPLGAEDDISGTIQITMFGTWRCAEDSTYVQPTQFEVQIMDRARNRSNIALSPIFDLNCK